MSPFFCSLFSGTISAADGCILELASHQGSTVVPLLLEGPFLPLLVCKCCVYASCFSPCRHLSTGWMIWAFLNDLCLCWEAEARYWSANQNGSAPSASLIRSLQTHLSHGSKAAGTNHMLLLAALMLFCFLFRSLPSHLGFWRGCQITCSLGIDQMQYFLMKSWRSYLPTEQAALQLAGRDGLGLCLLCLTTHWLWPLPQCIYLWWSLLHPLSLWPHRQLLQ